MASNEVILSEIKAKTLSCSWEDLTPKKIYFLFKRDNYEQIFTKNKNPIIIVSKELDKVYLRSVNWNFNKKTYFEGGGLIKKSTISKTLLTQELYKKLYYLRNFDEALL